MNVLFVFILFLETNVEEKEVQETRESLFEEKERLDERHTDENGSKKRLFLSCKERHGLVNLCTTHSERITHFLSVYCPCACNGTSPSSTDAVTLQHHRKLDP